MNAEVALASNDLATVKAMTRAGIEISMNKVDDISGAPALDDDAITAFLDNFDIVWDAASTSAKLDIWAEQFFISMVGNGIDAYNSYRRNGLPSSIQPNIEPSPGNSHYHNGIQQTTLPTIQTLNKKLTKLVEYFGTLVVLLTLNN